METAGAPPAFQVNYLFYAARRFVVYVLLRFVLHRRYDRETFPAIEKTIQSARAR